MSNQQLIRSYRDRVTPLSHKVSPYRLEEPGIELGTPGYKVSGLSATRQRLRCIWFYYFSLL